MSLVNSSQPEVLKELINFFSNPAISYPLGVIGGAIATISWKLIDVWIDGLKEDRKRRKAKKLQAAQDITSFCIEGMHKGFKIKAGSEQAIKFRAAEIEAIDMEVGIKLREFIGAWSMYRVFVKNGPSGIED